MYILESIKFDLIQYRFFRKLFKGTYYYIESPLTLSYFWSENEITSCGSKVIELEVF